MTLKKFKSFIIPLVLIFGYLIFISYPYFFSKINRFDRLGLLSVVEESSVNLQQNFNQDRATDEFDNRLLKGERITAKIKASDDNFGILLFKFAKVSSKASDTVVFRIKEGGKDKWHYENRYKSDQFQIDQYFTFGFLPFENSKNETYIFEIESLAGTLGNSIGVSEDVPRIALVYKYSKKDLTNPAKLLSFTNKKITYIANNANPWQNRALLIASLLFYLFIYFIRKEKTAFTKLKKGKSAKAKGFLSFLNFLRWSLNRRLKAIAKFSNKLSSKFYATRFYALFFNTNIKKRLIIVLLLFLLAFLYRYAGTSPDQLGVSSFYAGLGGQGDYDQFIRAATCAVKTFCPAILGQNFLIESTILGIFYEIFGFVGGLKVYLYFMIILSSIVAILPYIILSRKNLFTVGGIIGSLFLASSEYLIHMALNLPPDNGSLFAFSMFFIVYLLTIHIGTLRLLIFFGLMGTIDGLNKLVFLINDLAVFVFFAPVFFFDKAKRINRFPFVKLSPKLILYSVLPLLVFLLIYSFWEYIVEVKFGVSYYLRSLIEGGSVYASSTDEGFASINNVLSKGNILEKLYYYIGSYIVMTKRVIQSAGLSDIFLAPIMFGLLFVTFQKRNFFVAKLLSILVFATFAIATLVLFRNNHLGIQEIGQYVYAWPDSIYVTVFLFSSIIFLFALNFKHQGFKFVLPILPYYIILIILTKNAPWLRMLAHVVVWSIILFSFLTDWVLSNANKSYTLKRLFIGPVILALFIFLYAIPKASSMVVLLVEGADNRRNEARYLKWVNQELPKNAIVLGGGKSDLVSVSENINKPVIYSSLWTGALLIKPKEVPGVKVTDFAVLDQLKIGEMPGLAASEFNIVDELRNKGNFKGNRYLILEDDIYLWRSRIEGIGDNLFSTPSATLLHGNDYSVKVYKFNPTLNKGIYELRLKEPSL